MAVFCPNLSIDHTWSDEFSRHVILIFSVANQTVVVPAGLVLSRTNQLTVSVPLFHLYFQKSLLSRQNLV